MGSTPSTGTTSSMETRVMPPRRGSGVFVAAGLLAVIAAGLCAYAFQLWNEERKVRAALEASERSVATLRKEQHATDEKLRSLEGESGERRAQLDGANDTIAGLQSKLSAAEARLGELEAEHAEVGERLAEFKALTAQFQRMIDSGKLEVHFRRGRMIVEMREQVLFPSASADLSEEGKGALREVATILRGVRERHFIVAGHTDDIPIGGPGAAFANNWELSTARAVHVTEALIRFGLAPRQLVAAGYAEYDPIATNTTAQGRKKNRRIEIVLEPRLRELPRLEALAAKKP